MQQIKQPLPKKFLSSIGNMFTSTELLVTMHGPKHGLSSAVLQPPVTDREC